MVCEDSQHLLLSGPNDKSYLLSRPGKAENSSQSPEPEQTAAAEQGQSEKIPEESANCDKNIPSNVLSVVATLTAASRVGVDLMALKWPEMTWPLAQSPKVATTSQSNSGSHLNLAN